MFFITVDDPIFKWLIALGLLTFSLAIVLEIRFRRKQKEKGLLPERIHNEGK